jgi:hypothetical protein
MALSKHCLKRRAAVLVALGLCAVGRGAEFAGGTGGANDPYLIATAEQFNAVGADPNLWNKHFKLVADIDLGPYAGASFNMIGHHFSNADNKPFIGVFDGNDRTISNSLDLSVRPRYRI